jgi:hypothetical protein
MPQPARAAPAVIRAPPDSRPGPPAGRRPRRGQHRHVRDRLLKLHSQYVRHRSPRRRQIRLDDRATDAQRDDIKSQTDTRPGWRLRRRHRLLSRNPITDVRISLPRRKSEQHRAKPAAVRAPNASDGRNDRTSGTTAIGNDKSLVSGRSAGPAFGNVTRTRSIDVEPERFDSPHALLGERPEMA